MLTWMFMPYRRYAEFGGRSQRAEYWYFTLLIAVVTVAMTAVFGNYTAVSQPMGASYGVHLTGTPGVVWDILYLGSLIPQLAVSVRRLHDQERSGWLLLIGLIPILGGIALLVLMCLDGTHGPNRYGPDPKHQGDVDVFS